MTSEIASWLQNPEFSSGLLLYKKYSSNKAFVFLFEQKIYKLERLISELEKIEKEKPVVKTQLPDVIVGLINSKNIAWKEASNLHARLMSEPSKSERHKMAKRITDLSKIFKDCWAKLDKYEETGDYSFLVEETNKKDTRDLFQLFNDYTLKKNYILKAKNELKKIDDASKKEIKASHLAKLESDLSSINERLTILNNHILEQKL